MQTHTHTYTHTHSLTHTRSLTHTHTHSHTHIHTHTHTRTHTHTHMHIHTHIRTHTHARTHTHTYTHIRTHKYSTHTHNLHTYNSHPGHVRQPPRRLKHKRPGRQLRPNTWSTRALLQHPLLRLGQVLLPLLLPLLMVASRSHIEHSLLSKCSKNSRMATPPSS